MRPHLLQLLLLSLCLTGCQGVGSRSLDAGPTADEVKVRLNDDGPPATVDSPAMATSASKQIVLHTDHPLENRQRLLEDLSEERSYIAERLNLAPPATPVHIYLFAKQAAYHDHVHAKFPQFPTRRAIFVSADNQLSVYAHGGDHLVEDLRHEATHGFLHAATPNLPLWLDEGLAEFFEVGRGREGLHRGHVDYLLGQQAIANWKPDLERLEQITDAALMTQLDYAESWLWVHFLLESAGDKSPVLTAYLADLRSGTAEDALSVRLSRRVPNAGDQVAAHLGKLPR
ncbi:hypothetical protein [Adhaeretor mobilis]|uniref:DUF1570 domain-containing protein n=1 Tax=Adhaeretor mobilis TaxID=1930276 RepID=A0A517MUS3_9BACT|nr:hypothetical protein [Adhaeretor mobilis]QDS98628.1 hypothetical protein HG15A2_19090 [Adhaeretor mobilis]